MFEPKIKIPRELYEKIAEAIKPFGVSIEEFATKALATELERVLMNEAEGENSKTEAQAAAQLKGLGYLD